MTSTLPQEPVRTRRRSAGRERIFDVELVGHDPAALVRVLTILRRRCCEITHVEFDAGDRHRPGHLVVGIEPPPTHGHTVAAWLENLVDVRAARARD
jgi:hypothetical protein